MLFRNPRVFAFVLLAVGGGVLAYYGEQYSRLPEWTEAEIEQSVELNLALDLRQRGPLLQPTGERLEQLRGIVRAEVRGEIERERRTVQRWLAAGLMLCMFGGMTWLADLLRPRRSH
jgi:hypothetical protein